MTLVVNGFFSAFFRGVYIASVFYHKDNLLVTNEDQIPIVEVDDSYSSSLMQDFLWFTKVCENIHPTTTLSSGEVSVQIPHQSNVRFVNAETETYIFDVFVTDLFDKCQYFAWFLPNAACGQFNVLNIFCQSEQSPQFRRCAVCL